MLDMFVAFSSQELNVLASTSWCFRLTYKCDPTPVKLGAVQSLDTVTF